MGKSFAEKKDHLLSYNHYGLNSNLIWRTFFKLVTHSKLVKMQKKIVKLVWWKGNWSEKTSFNGKKLGTLHECIEPISTYVCASESVEKISVASQLQSICVSFYTFSASIENNLTFKGNKVALNIQVYWCWQHGYNYFLLQIVSTFFSLRVINLIKTNLPFFRNCIRNNNKASSDFSSILKTFMNFIFIFSFTLIA